MKCQPMNKQQPPRTKVRHPGRRAFGTAGRGFTLVEILVAMALGLVLIAGATNLFLGSSRTFSVNESLSRMQEDARFVMNRMARDVRMAGFQGCAPSDTIVNDLDTSQPEYLAELYGGGRIIGWDWQGTHDYESPPGTSSNAAHWRDSVHPNGSGDLLVSAQILSSEPARHSDIFVINRAHVIGDVAQVNAPGQGVNIRFRSEYNLPQGAIVMMVDDACNLGEIFQQTNQSSSSNDQITINKTGDGLEPGNMNDRFVIEEVDDDTQFFDFLSTAYYITEDSDGVPGLYEERIDASESTPRRELARGVENMQVTYGVAASRTSTTPVAYVRADQVTNWNRVVSLRIALLMRSVDPVNPETSNRIYNLNGVQVNPSGDDGDRYLRTVLTRTITMRNPNFRE